MQDAKTTKEAEDKGSLTALSIVVLIVFLLLVGGIYWWVSKKGKGETVFPAGLNYTGEETTPQAQRPSYDYAKMAESADWVDFVSAQGQYKYKHPTELYPLVFPGDVNDAVTFDIAAVPAQLNLMVLVETISNYDPKYRGNQEGFVRNYHTFFDGLKGVSEIEEFTTDQGLEGWRVKYITGDDSVGTNNYFFEIPGESNKILHVNNIFPAEGQAVFTRLLNSVEIVE
ncbi:hypothetical protein A2774_03650 [Candidatus Roizmanbacteria bacterium RIFCSPHIGHO2_01_FULL_39_12c]|uniref:Uncharacterized protein n=1 Tax=Candidatus Roizmanbacteria bacterium RIFCSPHIGHO2_01_FULL_39_12c TaxID=1802031 RepID=A0A1F7GFI2_9BACT|nr:MAG: hypothetical protein A2774_03650 [Candidatus Roizmanbacteria bacterium RIFCSPHIGHO2_01_FULL_39_12c]OGK48158.1 MAG: hypothetical protein A2963_04395 [Candidatus Roizmanbacteria bacterium RIFCSPLOWO2_01_FULL_40_13]